VPCLKKWGVGHGNLGHFPWETWENLGKIHGKLVKFGENLWKFHEIHGKHQNMRKSMEKMGHENIRI